MDSQCGQKLQRQFGVGKHLHRIGGKNIPQRIRPAPGKGTAVDMERGNPVGGEMDGFDTVGPGVRAACRHIDANDFGLAKPPRMFVEFGHCGPTPTASV